MVAATLFNILSSRSIIVTSCPRVDITAATSRPIYPPPITSTDVADFNWTAILSTSSMFLNV